MHKGFILKTVFLILLAAVLVAVVVVMRARFGAAGTAGTQTFFEQFVVAGGPVVWFVLLPISLITVYLAVEHCLTIRRTKLLPYGVGSEVVEIVRQFGPGQLEAQIADKDDFVSVAVVRALAQGRGDWFRMRSLLAESLQDQAWTLLRRIEWLNLIGNVSPMVGLFGTVYGMIKLFNAIVISGGQPQPAQLAGGISVALVTTFWGLFIAIPALAIHGVFRNRIETLVSEAVVEAENIMPEIRRGLKQQQQTQSARAGKAAQPIRELASRPSKKISRPMPSR